MSNSTVTHDEYTQKIGDRGQISHPSGSQIFAHDGSSEFGRSLTQEEFTPKIGEKSSLVKHMGELRIDTTGIFLFLNRWCITTKTFRPI